MTYAERLYRWNRWYDEAPTEWRFQIIFWFMIAAGAINMSLTIANGFPFGLLVLVAAIWVASVRVPYALGWVLPGSSGSAPHEGAIMQIAPPEWVHRLNLWYDAVPEHSKPFYMLGSLVIVGWLNMMLTITYAFTFGLLFLLGLLAVIAIRAPYVAGWYIVPASAGSPLALPPQAARIEAPAQRIEHADPAATPDEPTAS